MHLHKWLEETFDVVVTDTDAGVMHVHLKCRVTITVSVTEIALNTHFTLMRELDRVGDNIHNDLTQTFFVCLHALVLQLFKTVARAHHFEVQMLLLHHIRKHTRDILNVMAHIELGLLPLALDTVW